MNLQQLNVASALLARGRTIERTIEVIRTCKDVRTTVTVTGRSRHDVGQETEFVLDENAALALMSQEQQTVQRQLIELGVATDAAMSLRKD